jgi:Ca-activated chloride channel family protein
LLRWPGFARFFAQLVREHQRKPESAELPLQVHVRDGAAQILLDARDADRNFIHDLDASAQLIAGGPRVRLHEQAPGLYEGRLPLPGYGTFALRVTHARPGGALEHSHAVAYRPYPDEYAPGSPNRQLLEAAATRTHGRAVSEPHDVFRPAHAPISTRRELWPYVAWSCLGLFLLDQLLRRIRKSTR